MNPTPIPSQVVLEQLQLLHQVQTHTIPPIHAFLLEWLLGVPFPISMQTRLNLYYALLPIVSHWPPLFVAILLLFWEVWVILGLILLYFLIRFLIKLFYFISPQVFRLASKKEVKRVYLQLIFPSDTSKSAYATQQLYILLHGLARRKTFLEDIAHVKKSYSLELVASKKEGIRYIVVADDKDAEVIKRSIVSYLPGVKIKEVDDYIQTTDEQEGILSISDLKLSGHFSLPLQKQNILTEHDIIGYLTGYMTQLSSGELISFQLIATPVLNGTHQNLINEMKTLRYKIYKQEALSNTLQKSPFDELVSLPIISFIWWSIKAFFVAFKFAIMFVFSMFMAFADHRNQAAIPFFAAPQINIPTETLNPYEQELKAIVKEKIDQQLFETSIRIFIKADDEEEIDRRLSGILASFSPMSTSYQSVTTKGSFLNLSSFARRFTAFKDRLLSTSTRFNSNPILSSAEIADFYHFPYTSTTKTEDMVKTMSPELPTSLTLKNTDFDVIFGKNTYGNTEVPIGLTDDDRSRHVYMLGQTGSGKTTIIFHMAKDDIQKGRGIAVIDPHGDLAEDLLETVPLKRKDDLIYLNPFDLKYPIGINLLELTEGLDEDAMELEKELVTESVISIFRRVFSSDEKSNAHRIEYVLRNAIYTSFTIPDRTIFTIYDLLNNPDYQRKVIKNITDENLQNFWKYELGRAGNYQIVKMVSGVTAKVGRFLFSPTAKRILEQPKSTINFDWILDSGKILICNLAEGKLGEDTSQLLGTMILAKIQQAAFRRSRMNIKIRKPFYLYIDEFQNFATSSFTKMLSGGRKFSLRITIAEQSTTQQDDRNVTNTILANTGTVICFRTASPIDEDLMLTQFRPLVEKGDIANLPRYHFYIKLAAIEPQDTFSGETLPIVLTRDQEKIDKLIHESRKNWAILYKKKVVTKDIPVAENKRDKGMKAKKSNVLPDDR